MKSYWGYLLGIRDVPVRLVMLEDLGRFVRKTGYRLTQLLP